MNGVALFALALAELAAQDPISAPPRVRIAGQHSIHAVSRVVFTSTPETPHLLASTFGFPERVRTELSREGGRASERRLAYRFGTSFWTLPLDSQESGAVSGESREFLSFEFALRRALLLWPDGHTWSAPEAGRRTAELELLAGTATLVATGSVENADAPPARLALIAPGGRERIRFEALTWERENERWRPRAGRYVLDDRPIWKEEFLLVDRRARLVDPWFVPPDRRRAGSAARGADANRQISTLDLRPSLVRRRALEGEPDLAKALELARELLAETEPPPGHRLAGDLCVELDANGRPRAVSVWMEPWSPSPPPGWETFPGGPALGRWLPGPEAARADVLAEMIRRAGPLAGDPPRLLLRVEERESGTPRVRVHLLLQGETR